MDEIRKDTISVDQTLSLKKVGGAQVVTPQGYVLGKVRDVRVSSKAYGFQGVVVSKGLFRKKRYISREYIKECSPEAIMLSIEPLFLLKGKKVVEENGEQIGTISQCIRGGTSNQLHEIVIRKNLFRKFHVSASKIKSIGTDTVILKKGVHE